MAKGGVLWRKLRAILGQTSPNGLISPRYLWPALNPQSRLHRALFWAGKPQKHPRVIWSVLQLWYWLRWCVFDLWRNIRAAMKDHSTHAAQAYGLSKPAQLAKLIRYGLGWCADPWEMYDSGLIQQNRAFGGYVFENETRGFHAVMNRHHKGAPQAKALLSDKHDVAQRLQKSGINVAPATHLVPAGTEQSLMDILPDDGSWVFCKSRFGNRGLGAFCASNNQGNISLKKYDSQQSEPQTNPDAVWRALLSRGDVLVQPYLQNHHDIAQLSDTSTTITLRIITTLSDTFSQARKARLEIPIWDETYKDSISYVLIGIDMETGRLTAPKDGRVYGQAWVNRAQSIADQMQTPLPFWQEILTQSNLAHQKHIDLWAVAWDWAITPDGAVLLEGNAGFGLDTIQMQGTDALELLMTPLEPKI